MTEYTPSGSPNAYTVPALLAVLDVPTALRTLVDDIDALIVGLDAAVDARATITYADGKIAKSLMDAKGDLIVATAADTPARLPVGADGLALVADSAEATGMAWKRRGWEPVLDAVAPGSASFIDLDAILFDGYLTIIEWEGAIGASSTSLALQMLASGTPVTGANYNYGGYLANAGQTSAVVGFISAEGAFGEIRVAKGANAAATRIDGDCVNGTSAPVVGDQGAVHTLTTAYTGVRLISASGSNLAAGSRFAVYRVKV